MAIPITIPRLGWNMEEGVFAGWIKKDGEVVRPGEPLFRLEGDKALQDIEGLDSGILRIPPYAPKEGDKVAVGAVIAWLVQPGEALPLSDMPRTHVSSAKAAAPAGPAARRLARELQVDVQSVAGSATGGRITPADVRARAAGPVASPRARRLARELGVDWTRLAGSGRGGRIRDADVRTAALHSGERVVSLTAIRRTTAERLLHSLRTTAPVTLTTTVDANNLVSLRKQFQAAGQDTAPTYTDFLVKLTALTLREHPALNSRLEGEHIVLSHEVHVGVAVDTEAGLLVPVVRDAGEQTLRQISARTRDLIARARRRELRAEEMEGGTFTITNLGAFGIEVFTPILQYPQCAILGIGRIRLEAVVRQDQVLPGKRLTLSLTFDHRIVDGAPAARFLQALSRAVENPAPLLMP
jgi:pyruvate dehydrogenase E2 component (dihydrolipoamide acetyltransferase)